MVNRKEIKMNYKMTERPVGVYQISNSVNDKIFIGKAMNLDGTHNRINFQLKLNSHKNKTLQNDWNELGEDKFEFKILEQVDTSDKSSFEIQESLNNLEKSWLEKLQPHAQKE